MNRPFLFMSGEFRVSMPLAFLREQWQHTMTPDNLVITNGVLHRSKRPAENLSGIIHYADVGDKEIERQNLQLIVDNHIPCWPNPHTLLRMLNRHEVMVECVDGGFISHNINQWRFNERSRIDLQFPFVAKLGNSHRGIGKYLIHDKDELDALPEWEGLATFEPYFEGTSVRALVLDDYVTGIKVENDNSWIKNSSGAETSVIKISEALSCHAKAVCRYFNLEVAGVDYIVEPNGSFHFLEVNQYPGIDVSDEVSEIAKSLLNNAMNSVEHMAENIKFDYSNNMYVGP